MKIHELDALQRQLQLIYTPLEPRRLMPSELGEEIILVHPAQPTASGFSRIQGVSPQGAVGATLMTGVEVPADHFFWVHAFSVSHDDAVTRTISIGLRNVATGQEVALLSINNFALTDFAPAPRSFLVPAGWQVYARLNAIGAGQVISGEVIFLDMLEAEESPKL